jgi:hypothetical protein
VSGNTTELEHPVRKTAETIQLEERRARKEEYFIGTSDVW